MYLPIYVDIWLELSGWVESKESNCWKVIAWKKVDDAVEHPESLYLFSIAMNNLVLP